MPDVVMVCQITSKALVASAMFVSAACQLHRYSVPTRGMDGLRSREISTRWSAPVFMPQLVGNP